MENFLQPLEKYVGFDEIENQINSLFLAVLTDLMADKINDIYNYGTPAYASQLVLERFIKQIGLVVVRRPETSHEIMRILYENWSSLASKRGLAFLEFALEMLWTKQWKIIRLWHDISLSDQYPNLVTTEKQANSFLTSRIYVLMDYNVDQKELEILLPSLGRLVPAHIVPEIGVGIFPEDFEIGMATAINAVQIGYFVPTDW